MAEQLDMFGMARDQYRHGPARPDAKKRPSIDDRWAEFHHANPHVMNALLRLARARLESGQTRIGVKALWEELRSYLKTSGTELDFRLNNDFTAPAARTMIELEPTLAGVIEVRRRRNEVR